MQGIWESPAVTFLALGNRAKGNAEVRDKVGEGSDKSLQFSNSHQRGYKVSMRKVLQETPFSPDRYKKLETPILAKSA